MSLSLKKQNAQQPSGGSRGPSSTPAAAPRYGGASAGNSLTVPGKNSSSLTPQKTPVATMPQNLNQLPNNPPLNTSQAFTQNQGLAQQQLGRPGNSNPPPNPFNNTASQINAQPQIGVQNMDSQFQAQPPMGMSQPNHYGGTNPSIAVRNVDANQPLVQYNRQVPSNPALAPQQSLLKPMETPMIQYQASEDPTGFSTRKNRQQNWQSLHKVHKKVGAEIYLQGFNARAPTRSFIMSTKGILNIPQSDITLKAIEAVHGTGGLTATTANNNARDMIPQAKPLQDGCKYYIEYYATLYNKTKETFYGRTYRSQKKLLVKHGTDSLQCLEEDWAFFHTSYTDPHSVLIIECVMVAVDARGMGGDQKIDKRYGSLGFAMIDLFGPDGSKEIRRELFKGSPRNIQQILRNELHSTKRAPSKVLMPSITFHLQDFTQFDFLKDLVPQNCFVGAHDKVPGYVSDELPDYKSFLQAQVRPDQNSLLRRREKKPFYLQRIKLNIPMKLEEVFIGFLQRMASKSRQENKAYTESARILERRLLVSVNNTWKDLSEEQVCSLSQPNNLGVSIFSGNLTIPDWINHPLIALIFKIEYIAEVPFDGIMKKASFMLGYKVHLPEMINLGADPQIKEQDLNLEFEMGPGFSPNQFSIWPAQAISDSHIVVKMSANLAIDPNSLKPESNFTMNQPILTPQQQQNTLQHPGMRGAQIPAPQPYGMGMYNQPPAQQNFNFFQDPVPQHQVDPAQMQLWEQEKRQLQQMLEQKSRETEIFKRQQMELQLQQAQGLIHNQQLPSGYQDPMQRAQLNQLQAVIEANEIKMHQMQNHMQQMMHQQLNPQMNGYQDARTPIGSSQEIEIARIGNVFYNMLNIIGENEKDKRILGLSTELKTLMQQRQFDDLLGPKVPYVGQNQINLMKVTDLPAQDHANFIKAGYGDVLMNPSAQINTGRIEKDRLQLQLEQDDPLQASTIAFKFICFKTPWQSLDKIPDRFYFQFKFFTFPLLLTDKVRIKHERPQNEATHSAAPGLKGGFPYYLEKDRPGRAEVLGENRVYTREMDSHSTPELISAEFTIDPSVSKIWNEHVRLAEYMRERFLVVDIFDGDSLFVYGSCKIPLFELLRQQKPQLVKAKEAELCDPLTGESRGSIQFIMTNTGKAPQIMDFQPQKGKTLNQTLAGDVQRLSPERKAQPSQKDQHKHKKIIKSNPIQQSSFAQPEQNIGGIAINQMGLGYTDPAFKSKNLGGDLTKEELSIINSQNADQRKKLRVDRMRQKNLGGPNTGGMLDIEDPMQNDWQKIRSLQKIEMIRNSKKGQVLQQVLADYTSDVQRLYVQPGKQEFFTIPLNNYYQSREVFTVIVQDPEADVVKELTLVSDQAEWRHWTAEGKCMRPPEFSIITAQNDVILEPNQTVELLFKFSTLRDCLTHFQAANQIQEVRTQIVPRKIQICIFESKSRPHLVMDVQIIPSSAPIDQTFRYYEPENSHVSISIPPFAQLNFPGISAVVSDPSATCEVDHESNVITVETSTKSAPEISALTLFIYGDQFKEKILATLRIEIYAMVAVFSQVRAGVGQQMSLSLPMDRARVVQLYSEDFRQIYLPSRKNTTQYRLVPSSVNHLNIVAKMNQMGPQKVRMHCVDVNTGELVYAWLLSIEASKPKHNITHEVNLKMNSSQSEILQYQNRHPSTAVFEFTSSNPKIMVPKEEAVAIEGRQVKNITLQFFPRKRYGQEEVYLFIADSEQKIVECMLLKLMIIP